MKYIRTLTIFFAVLSILLSGCGKQTDQPEFIAESIRVSYQTASEITLGSPMTAWIKNTTKYCLEFPLGDGVKVFAQQKDKWVEVPNLVTFIGSQVVTLKPEGDSFSERRVDIRPDTSNLTINAPTKFYALLTGHLCDDSSFQIQKEIPFTIIP